SYRFVSLYGSMEYVSVDPEIIHPEQLTDDLSWRLVPESRPSLSADSVWWYRCIVTSVIPDSVDYILKGDGVGYVDFFVFDTAGTELSHFKVGKYRKASEKPLNRTSYSHAPVRFGPGTFYIYIRAEAVDHQSVNTNWNLESPVSWYSRPAHAFDQQTQFFQGVFWILIIYNLVLFFSLRIPSYFYYAAYLICVSGFVSFTVGTMSFPSFGDPRWLAPLGFFFFGGINIFYYLFGKDFLSLHELLPKWDRFIDKYLIVKLIVLVLVQVNLFTWFHIPVAVVVEFSMVGLDIVISILLYIALLKTRKQLAYFFVAGSSAVIVFGISAAIIGSILQL
ncbi:MAG: 7TM-DISM domain-containing protein, partial [Bacteroidota bacterium]